MRFGVCVLAVICFRGFGASYLQPSDIDYYIHDGPQFSFVFSKNFLDDQNFVHLYKKLNYYNQLYRGVFSGRLKEKPVYVFASPRNQISNAVTSGVPFLRVVFFPAGVEQITDLAVISWLDTLAAHEMAHIYQLGQTSDYLRYLRAVFKNSEFVLLPFPLFLNVNMVLPAFLLEGHAVLNESIFAPGGRLYSGEARAFVFAQLKHSYKTTEHFIKNYLLNYTNRVFSMKEKYTHGGYFFASLTSKYGLHRVNNIFKNHADHFIVPLSLLAVKSTFERTFGVGFESLVHYYVSRWLPKAVRQKKSNQKILFKSAICPPFNREGDEVFFLTGDVKSPPFLRIFNRPGQEAAAGAQGVWSRQRKVFAEGKIFKVGSRYYVSASHNVSPIERVYGLFSEGMYFFDSKYRSQSVQDMFNEDWLSIGAANNMNHFRLFLNGRFYDDVHSTALFDAGGRVYYFKQEGFLRVMYRDKKPLFSFKGFYGKPVAGGGDGSTVYFIAASELGSSLFGWREGGGVYRVSSSDVIKEAVRGPEGQFLVCEIGPDFYTYKIIPEENISEQPVFYNYNLPLKLPTENQLAGGRLSSHKGKLRPKAGGGRAPLSLGPPSLAAQPLGADKPLGVHKQPLLGVKPPPVGVKPLAVGDRQPPMGEQGSSLGVKLPSLGGEGGPSSLKLYNSFGRIRFNGVEVGAFHDPITRYNLITGISFRDMLEYNSFNFFYQVSKEHWVFQAKYLNARYRWPWGVQYFYKQGYENFFGARAYSYIHEFSSYIYVPLFRKGYWLSKVRVKGALASMDLKQVDQDFYFSWNPSWYLQYIRKYRNNFIPERDFFLKLDAQYHAQISLEDSNFLMGGGAYYTHRWGFNFYTTPFVSYRTAVKKESIPFRHWTASALIQKPEWDIFLERRRLQQTNDYFFTGLRLQTVVDTAWYFSRWPISFMRAAPFGVLKYIEYLEHKGKPRSKGFKGAKGFKGLEGSNGFKGSNGRDQKKHMLEWTAGLDLEVLVHHKVPFKLSLHYGGAWFVERGFGWGFIDRPYVPFFALRFRSPL